MRAIRRMMRWSGNAGIINLFGSGPAMVKIPMKMRVSAGRLHNAAAKGINGPVRIARGTLNAECEWDAYATHAERVWAVPKMAEK
jgi:hypothetical protein